MTTAPSAGRPMDATGRITAGVRSGLTAAGIVLAFGLAACGDDDATADASVNGTPAADDETPTPAAFCDAALTLETASGPDVDFSQASDEEIAEAVHGWADAVLRPLADEVAAVAPTAIGAEVDVLSRAVDELLETGNVAAFDAPDAIAANDAYLDFTAEQCGWNTVEVKGVDYRFEGIPAELDAGPTRFVLANEGNELHELFVFRRNEGSDQPVDELLSLPEEQASRFLTPAGEPAFAAPGRSEQVVHDLEPGSYIAVCFIPTGTTSEDALPSPDAAPHAANGMVTEFTVPG